MRSKNKWLKDYPMIDYKKADCKKIRNSVGEKLTEQKGEVIYMKKRSFKPLAIIGAVLAVSAASVFTVNAATDGAVVDKLKEWTGNVRICINGEEVEVLAKIKEIDVDEDRRIVEFEVDDENSDDDVNIEYYEYYDESDIPDDLDVDMEISTENLNENK